MMPDVRRLRCRAAASVAVLLSALASCYGTKQPAPEFGGDTHWLRTCSSEAPCSVGFCICGVCTSACDTGQTCSGAACVSTGKLGDACNEEAPEQVCLNTCGPLSPCAEDQMCLDGVCIGRPTPVLPEDSGSVAADQMTLTASCLACTPLHPCIAELDQCDCSVPNFDNDAYDAFECGGQDCDDGDYRVSPGAAEVCDPAGVDEDCDPTTFHNAASPESDGDADGDGFIDVACFNIDGEGMARRGDDCEDDDPSTRPGAIEVCDYKDNDCDGPVDEAGGGTDGELTVTLYLDQDRDGFGDPATPAQLCLLEAAAERVNDATDCDDASVDVSPAHVEVCDDLDNDCNGFVDSAAELEPRPGEECVDGVWMPVP